jgi:hypothetical protein
MAIGALRRGDVPPSVFTDFQAKRSHKYLSFSNADNCFCHKFTESLRWDKNGTKLLSFFLMH